MSLKDVYLLSQNIILPEEKELNQKLSWVEQVLAGLAPYQFQKDSIKPINKQSIFIDKASYETILAYNSVMQLIKQLPFELKEADYSLKEALRNDFSLYCSIMFRSGYVGIRDLLRIYVDKLHEPRTLVEINGQLNALAPLTPLKNLPNLLGYEICNSLGLKGENSMFFAPSSGAMALMEAFRDLSLGVSKFALITSAFMFGPALFEIILANWQQFNYKKVKNYPKEIAVALCLVNQDGLELLKLRPQLKIKLVQLNLPKQDYTYSLPEKHSFYCAQSLYELATIENNFQEQLLLKHIDGQSTTIYLEKESN